MDRPQILSPNRLSQLTTAHPRLFFSASDIPRLQQQAATTHQAIWRPIQEFTQQEVEKESPENLPPSAAPPAGDLETYRNFGNQLIAHAFSSLISDDPTIREFAKEHLRTYASWTQWGENNFRDLGHAHMLFGNALAYDWLHPTLTPDERQTVGGSLADWAQKMFEASSGNRVEEWGNWWRKSYMQNHYWVNNSALGLAGLVLLGEDERAAMWVEHASERLSRVRHILASIEDGSWHEGILYQNYALTIALPFWVNLRRIQGIDLFSQPYLRNYILWRTYNQLPNSVQLILSYGNFEWEWGNSRQIQGVLRFLASEYLDGRAEWLAQALVEADGRVVGVNTSPWQVFEFLYYNPDIPARPPTDLPKSRRFPDIDGVIWRTGWDATDLVFGLKSSAYGGRVASNAFIEGAFPWEQPCLDAGCQLNVGHDHSDANTFYLHQNGRWLAPESEGVGRVESAFHNTVLIDGRGQYRPPAENFWRFVEDFVESDGFLADSVDMPNFNYLIADATRPYRRQFPDIAKVVRHVLFVQPYFFLMVDDLAATEPHRYDWVCHFSQGVTVEENWVRGSADESHILGVGVISPTSFESTIGDDGKPFIRLHPTEPTDALRFVNLLYPTTAEAWDTRPEMTLVEESGQALVVRVQFQTAVTQQSHDIILRYAQPDTHDIGTYLFDGTIAVISRTKHVNPSNPLEARQEKLFAYGGTFLKEKDRNTILFKEADPTTPFEVTYTGRKVEIVGEISAKMLLYAPHANRLIHNGKAQKFVRVGLYIRLA